MARFTFFIWILILACAGYANATFVTPTYSFLVEYDGKMERLLSKDNPLSTPIKVGESFAYTYSSAASGFWQLEGATNGFGSLLVSPATNSKAGDWAVTVLLNDAVLLHDSYVDTLTSFFHIGKIAASSQSMPAGTRFDEIRISYTLNRLSSNGSAADSSINLADLDPIYWGNNGKGGLAAIPYHLHPAEPVPEPASFLLFAVGASVMGAFGARRKG